MKTVQTGDKPILETTIQFTESYMRPSLNELTFQGRDIWNIPYIFTW